ncbi:MAG: IPT/TIG domain-containing protein, partial [Spirochaetaceae bacterium]|nr:IPT/TIG domain-containing protein [Spirochaetaceae bacterium]
MTDVLPQLVVNIYVTDFLCDTCLMFNVYRRAKAGLLLSAFLFAACGAETPRILAIDPKLAVTGQNLTIMGDFFGREQGESFVTIGGVNPTLSSYIEWGENKIVVQIPDFGES